MVFQDMYEYNAKMWLKCLMLTDANAEMAVVPGSGLY